MTPAEHEHGLLNTVHTELLTEHGRPRHCSPARGHCAALLGGVIKVILGRGGERRDGEGRGSPPAQPWRGSGPLHHRCGGSRKLLPSARRRRGRGLSTLSSFSRPFSEPTCCLTAQPTDSSVQLTLKSHVKPHSAPRQLSAPTLLS